MRYSVYVYYDANGSPLYVGQTGRGHQRAEEHARSKDWWQQVASSVVSHFDTQEDALSAEKSTIQELRPIHNIIHNDVIGLTVEDVPRFPLNGCTVQPLSAFEDWVAEVRWKRHHESEWWIPAVRARKAEIAGGPVGDHVQVFDEQGRNVDTMSLAELGLR